MSGVLWYGPDPSIFTGSEKPPGKVFIYREEGSRYDILTTKALSLKENENFEYNIVAVTKIHLQPECMSRKSKNDLKTQRAVSHKSTRNGL